MSQSSGCQCCCCGASSLSITSQQLCIFKKKTRRKKKEKRTNITKKKYSLQSISTGLRARRAHVQIEMYAQEQIIDHKKPSRQLVYAGTQGGIEWEEEKQGKGGTHTHTVCDWSTDDGGHVTRHQNTPKERRRGRSLYEYVCVYSLCHRFMPVRCGKSARRHPAARSAAAARKCSLSHPYTSSSSSSPSSRNKNKNKKKNPS